MSTHVIGLLSPDDPHHLKMVEVARACATARISFPPEVVEYFGRDAEGTDIVSDHLEDPLKIKIPARLWIENTKEGVDIAVEDIPEGVKTIRFYNSY